MIKRAFVYLAQAMAAGMDLIYPPKQKQNGRKLIPTDRAMPNVISNNQCKPKRKPRKHNKKKRGF